MAKKLFLIISGLLLSFFFAFNFSNAQTISQPIITWQANNFFPSDYPGKALPSPGTKVSLSVLIIKNGSVINLSEEKILWYVDSKLIPGNGIRNSFVASKRAGDSHFVQVVIETRNEKFENSIRIPVVAPSIAIQVPNPNNIVPRNSETKLKANPFFFNVSSLQDLKFFWKIGEEKIYSASENELLLKVGSPLSESQKNILLTASAENIKKPTEVGLEILRLKIQ